MSTRDAPTKLLVDDVRSAVAPMMHLPRCSVNQGRLHPSTMRNILSVSIVVGIVELATPSLGRADVVTADGGNAAPVAEPPRPAPEPLELRPCTDALRFSTGCTSVFG